MATLHPIVPIIPVASEGRSWGPFWINAALHFLNLQLIGMILALALNAGDS
jgi:hypothetical protein